MSEIPQEQVELLDQSFSSLEFPETSYSSESNSLSPPSPVKQFQASVAEQSRERANEYIRDIGVTPITRREYRVGSTRKRGWKQ